MLVRYRESRIPLQHGWDVNTMQINVSVPPKLEIEEHMLQPPLHGQTVKETEVSTVRRHLHYHDRCGSAPKSQHTESTQLSIRG